ncbi:MAG: FAD-binding protein, partial [Acidimicrobiia bacterium]
MTEAADGGWTQYQRVTPSKVDELASILRTATDGSLVVQVVGGGTRQGYGSPPPPDIVVDMSRLSGIETWDPDDLTVTLG